MTTTQIKDPTASSTAVTHTLTLPGCSPTPLAHYLKALAVLRLVGEQADAEARGWWRDDEFMLQTRLSMPELLDFFTERYRPTPLVAPWNGGSGFKLGKPKTEVKSVAAAESKRLAGYREVVEIAFQLMELLGFDDKVPKPRKEEYLEACRARFPDHALGWLDAVVVLTGDGAKYPPVLGTGGNDGRLEFTLNFQSRLLALFDFDSGEPTSMAPAWLEASLFDVADSHLQSGAAIGQYFPHAAGGTNQTTGFDAKTISNPWDFVLMLEGAVIFAAASVKRLESSGGASMSAPFCVRHVGVGHGSADPEEEADARPEMWMPLWDAPASSAQVQTLMAEGRAQIGRRAAGNSLDFARAVSQLGVDRGITEFVRYGFQMRNGRAYYATPLGRLHVKRRPQVDLIDDIDPWLERFRRAGRDKNAPSAVAAALRTLEESLFALCESASPSQVARVLVCLGECERTLARRPAWARSKSVRPLHKLTPQWVDDAYDGSPEFRLAASLAALRATSSIRGFLEPVETAADRLRFQDHVDRDVVWHEGDPVDALNAVMHRRIIRAQKTGVSTWRDRSKLSAWPEDIAAFIAGRVDVRRMIDLVWGLMLVDFSDVDPDLFSRPEEPAAHPDAFYSLMKLCFAGRPIHAGGAEVGVPLVPAIHRHAADGDGLRASKKAARRLLGSGLAPMVVQTPVQGASAKRAAAALLFPIGRLDLQNIKKRTIKNPLDPSTP
ncbi:MAG: type I-U CRISPR-associated protein Csx17 [Persicimonas sp.]